MFEDIKAGDQVFIVYYRGFAPSRWRQVGVERTTKTQIILDGGRRYRKQTGREVGSSSYEKDRIYEVNPETERQYIENVATCAEFDTRSRLIGEIRKVPWGHLKTSTLEKIVKAVGEDKNEG